MYLSGLILKNGNAVITTPFYFTIKISGERGFYSPPSLRNKF